MTASPPCEAVDGAPLWCTHAGVWAVDSARAVAAGLRCRPIRETVAGTRSWLSAGGHPVTHPRLAKHGIAPEKGEKILASASGEALARSRARVWGHGG